MQIHHNTSAHSIPVESIIGKKFGHLLILRDVSRRKGHRYVLYRCDCGTEKEVLWNNIRRGTSKSCGCMKNPNRLASQQGLPRIPEMFIWYAMLRRCEDPKDKAFVNYGSRGIKVCPRWQNSFYAFYGDVGPRPDPKYTIDRINNSGDYEPGNVRWVTREHQNQNKRTNRYITHNSETLTISAWARRRHISRNVLRWRLKHNWSVKEAIETPIGGKTTIAALAKKHNKKRQTVERRLQLGWSIQDALEKPIRHKISPTSTFAISPGKA